MNFSRQILFLVAFTAISSAQTVDYTKQIVPLWDTYCIDCHDDTDADGEFRIDTFSNLMKGGKEGVAIVAGKAKDSVLLNFHEGHSGRGRKNEIMPPGKREHFKSEQIALIPT